MEAIRLDVPEQPASALQLQEWIYRYMAMWHEADPALRRIRIEKLWTPDAVDYVRTFAFRGHDAIETRVASAHQKWVVEGGYVFQPAGHAYGLNNSIQFRWVMVPAAGGAPEGRGCDFIVLAQDGRIQCNYQFPGPAPETLGAGMPFPSVRVG